MRTVYRFSEAEILDLCRVAVAKATDIPPDELALCPTGDSTIELFHDPPDVLSEVDVEDLPF